MRDASHAAGPPLHLLLAVAAFAVAFVLGATVAFLLSSREPAPRPSVPRHLKPAHRHHAEPSREWLLWTVSLVVRAYRYEDGGPRTAVALASLFLVFSVLIGVSQ